jgi:SAM-dependent methyltransferase
MDGHAQHHSHDHGHQSRPEEPDWATKVSDITREGEVLMPYLSASIAWLAELCRRDGLAVRRVVDIGCGPGVGTCVLAQQFESAVVVAVDGSQEMLEAAAARAAALGLSERVHPVYVQLPAGLDQLGSADLVWAAMVLHHVDEQTAALRGLRSLLEPGGLLALAEFGDAARFLPDDPGVGRPGLNERLGDGNLWGHALPDDYLATIEAAGFVCIGDQMMHARLERPLSTDARRLALESLRRMRELAGERLDADDHAALDVLLDEDSPLGVMRREDTVFDVTRRVIVARAV